MRERPNSRPRTAVSDRRQVQKHGTWSAEKPLRYICGTQAQYLQFAMPDAGPEVVSLTEGSKICRQLALAEAGNFAKYPHPLANLKAGQVH